MVERYITDLKEQADKKSLTQSKRQNDGNHEEWVRD